VLEHVPEHDVPETLRRLCNFAHKFVFLTVATSPAKKRLPDGRNCHLTIRPEAWWWEQIEAARVAVGKPDLLVSAIIQPDDLPPPTMDGEDSDE
jgi:hypothetical protein